jgi:methyl-accepting chemotaxis protein
MPRIQGIRDCQDTNQREKSDRKELIEMMQITCDNCGKNYRVDESKIKGEKARFKCKACENIIVVSKSGPVPASAPPHGTSSPAAAAVDNQPEAASADRAAATEREPSTQPNAVQADTAVKDSAEGASDEDVPPGLARKRVRFGLFTKIILVMLLISLLPFVVFWGIAYKETVNRIRNESEQFFTLTAESLGTQVDGWIDNNILILKSATELPDIMSMSRPNQERVLRELQKKYPYMYLVFTVGLDGRNVARSDDVPLKDYSDRQYYKDIVQGKTVSWQTLIGKTSKKPALVISVPITSGGRLMGVLAAAMTIDELSKYIANWKRGQTGYAFLLDEKGKVVAHQVQSYVETQKNLNSYPLIAAYRKSGWTSLTTNFTNEKGKPSYGHVKEIARGWTIALEQEDTEVFAAIKRVQWVALILLAATIVVVSLIAWFSARAIVTPIMRLTEVAERMSLGDLNMQINIPSKDEIGLLAQAIKRMQTSLRLAMERLRRKR